MIKHAAIALSLLIATPAIACMPAPTCWIKTGPEYLKSICVQYVNTPLDPANVEEPAAVPNLVKACAKLHIRIKVK
jgi:hypothetical protein